MTIKIDEAIRMLEELKKNGQEYVLLSDYDLTSNTSYDLKKISIVNGIEVVQESISPIELNENSILKSLKTMNEREIIKYLLFH